MPEAQKSEALRFWADAPLGRLAKWLRLLGFDTCYQQGGLSDEAFEKGLRGRILLTKTRQTAHRFAGRPLVFIHADRPEDQLREVVSTLGIGPDDLRPFTRCLRCNRETQPVSRQAVKGRVPDYVWQTVPRFTICDGCARIYWPGTHTDRALDWIRTLFVER